MHLLGQSRSAIAIAMENCDAEVSVVPESTNSSNKAQRRSGKSNPYRDLRQAFFDAKNVTSDSSAGLSPSVPTRDGGRHNDPYLASPMPVLRFPHGTPMTLSVRSYRLRSPRWCIPGIPSSVWWYAARPET